MIDSQGKPNLLAIWRPAVVIRLVFLALIVGIVLFPAASPTRLLCLNLWSLHAASAAQKASRGEVLAAFPSWHPRYQLWQGRFALLRGDLESAQFWFNKQLIAFPADVLAIEGLGEAKIRMGQTEAGIADFIQSRALVQLEALGDKSMQEKQWEKAVIVFQTLVSVNPRNLKHTRCLAASIYKGKHDVQASTKILFDAITPKQGVEDTVALLSDIGSIYQDARLWSQAESIYEKILEHMPLNAAAWANLGWSQLYLKKKPSIALLTIKKGVRLATNDSDIYMTSMILGDFYSSQKQYGDATNAYETARQHASVYPWPSMQLGNMAIAVGDYGRAMSILKNTASQFPFEGLIFYRLAAACYLANDYNCAKEAIGTALVLSPSEIDYWLLCGQIYEKLKDIQKAEAAYSSALHLDPNQDEAKKSLLRVRNHAGIS